MSEIRTRLYVVTSTDESQLERLVRAGSKARAVRAAAIARMATQADLERLFSAGVKVEGKQSKAEREAAKRQHELELEPGRAVMRALLRCDGTREDLPEALTLPQIAELIGATGLDFVALRHMGAPLHVMALDDHGHVSIPIELGPGHIRLQPIGKRKPVNEQATELYWQNCRPGTTHQIVGDVVVMPDIDL